MQSEMGMVSRWMTVWALLAIRLYQRWLSPYKGYVCAYRVHRGGESCSAYGMRVIARFGLWRGVGLLRRRFVLCGEAAQACEGRHAVPSMPIMPRRYEAGDCDPGCDPGCDAGCDSNPLDNCHPGDLAEGCVKQVLGQVANDACSSACDGCGDGCSDGAEDKQKKQKPMSGQAGHCDLPAMDCDADLRVMSTVSDAVDLVLNCGSAVSSCQGCGNGNTAPRRTRKLKKYQPLPKKI